MLHACIRLAIIMTFELISLGILIVLTVFILWLVKGQNGDPRNVHKKELEEFEWIKKEIAERFKKKKL